MLNKLQILLIWMSFCMATWRRSQWLVSFDRKIIDRITGLESLPAATLTQTNPEQEHNVNISWLNQLNGVPFFFLSSFSLFILYFIRDFLLFGTIAFNRALLFLDTFVCFLVILAADVSFARVLVESGHFSTAILRLVGKKKAGIIRFLRGHKGLTLSGLPLYLPPLILCQCKLLFQFKKIAQTNG